MVDFFVQIMCQFLLDIFISVMGLSIGSGFVLSAQNEANRVKHRGQSDEIGIVSLTYVLGIGGIQIHISYCKNALYIQVVDIYNIFSYTV